MAASSAHAQTPAADPTSPPPADSAIKSTLLFFSGAAAGLVIHESGHVMFGAAFGANPRVRSLEGSIIPFFKIQHDSVSRRKEYVISSAGMWMQYANSEWILTARPRLRDERAPFLKGILACDLATATVDSAAAFARKGPIERDTRGMADSLGSDGVGEPVVGVLLLTPAVLDGYRYLRPESKWAAWASRTAKIASVAL